MKLAFNLASFVLETSIAVTTFRWVGGHNPGQSGPGGQLTEVRVYPAGTVPACAEAGILGALTGVVGSMMALEVIREIVEFGEGLVGRLLMMDARSMRFETLSYAWDPANPLSGEKPTIRDLSSHK